jgi:hypothetical protein
MSEVAALFPILFLVYVLQCFAVAPPASIAFYLNYRLRGRLLPYLFQVGRAQYKLYLQDPFLPFKAAAYVALSRLRLAVSRLKSSDSSPYRQPLRPRH